MNKMVRQQLFITAEQKRRIKTRSSVTGLSEGEIIRRGIDRELRDKSAEAQGDWKDAWRQAAGMWKDHEYIDELLEDMHRNTRMRLDRVRRRMRAR